MRGSVKRPGFWLRVLIMLILLGVVVALLAWVCSVAAVHPVRAAAVILLLVILLMVDVELLLRFDWPDEDDIC